VRATSPGRGLDTPAGSVAERFAVRCGVAVAPAPCGQRCDSFPFGELTRWNAFCMWAADVRIRLHEESIPMRARVHCSQGEPASASRAFVIVATIHGAPS